MKKALMGAGILLGAYLLIDNLNSREESKEDKKTLGDTDGDLQEYKVKFTNTDDDVFMEIVVIATDRDEAVGKASRFINDMVYDQTEVIAL